MAETSQANDAPDKNNDTNQKIPGGAAAKTMTIKRNGKMATIDIIKLRRMLKDLSTEDVRNLHAVCLFGCSFVFT